MLCDKCKKNEANVHVSRYINGAMYEQNLCAECAGLSGDVFSGFGDMFGGIREMAMMNAMRGMVPEALGQGRDTMDFEALGLKLPVMGQEEQKHVEAEEPQNRQEEKTLEGLRAQLAQAVEAQEFEKAATLRDEIYFMEKEKERE
ncbi:UvrB/UvrC motif-containing protein [Christensenellaceae bacterium OttesenSCG-928-K19]|nr:UvrB/UvrC motif-containing protein [Christensenellaceae bacterium OttesenSCG-928-K19]